jgi:hypothetical protein
MLASLLELLALVQQVLSMLDAIRSMVSDLKRTSPDATSLYDALPPIWPGAATAALKSPVALAPLLTINGPMSGILVQITAAPAGQGTYDYNGLTEYRYIGSLTFLTDGGKAERYQQLGFADAIYTPGTMHAAASVHIRTYDGVVGTVTPWTIA